MKALDSKRKKSNVFATTRRADRRVEQKKIEKILDHRCFRAMAVLRVWPKETNTLRSRSITF
jgi:hypothetical protein